MAKLEAQQKKILELDTEAKEIIASNKQMDFYKNQLEIQYVKYKIKQLKQKSTKIEEAYDVLSVAGSKGPKDQNKESVLKYFRKKRKQLKFGQNLNSSNIGGRTSSYITDNDSRRPSVRSGITDNILGGYDNDTSQNISMMSIHTKVDVNTTQDF